jgi:threonine dehydrogenase-like Zn-dependent dehydrogenase
VRVPLADSTLVVIPEGVSDEEGILLGDILSTAFFCAENAGLGTTGAALGALTGQPPQPAAAAGSSSSAVAAAASGGPEGEAGEEGDEAAACLVVGCGPVGLLAVLASKHFGAKKVRASLPPSLPSLLSSFPPLPSSLQPSPLLPLLTFYPLANYLPTLSSQIFAVDTVPERLAFAERLGAAPLDLMRLGADGVIQAVRAETGGRGADHVMELVGSSASLRLAFDAMRPMGVLSR